MQRSVTQITPRITQMCQTSIQTRMMVSEEWRALEETMTSRRSKLIAVMAALGFLATGPVANAQAWYYVNGQPVSPGVAQQLAARGLPFGYYWLQNNGNWGVVGNADVVGNIYGRRPSLSQRGLLYSPGELLR
jgi:hypothetical protein